MIRVGKGGILESSFATNHVPKLCNSSASDVTHNVVSLGAVDGASRKDGVRLVNSGIVLR